MSKVKQVSKTMQLHMIRTIVINTTTNTELLAFFESHGCPQSQFEKGNLLYNAASVARAAEIATEDELREVEERILNFQKVIRDTYTIFADSAKKCFGKDALEMLGLQKNLPRSNRSCCEYARTSFSKMEEHPQLSNRLSEYGFGKEDMISALSLVDAYDRIVTDSDKLKMKLATASKEQTLSFERIRVWLQQFISLIYPDILEKKELIEQLGLEPDLFSSFIEKEHLSASLSIC